MKKSDQPRGHFCLDIAVSVYNATQPGLFVWIVLKGIHKESITWEHIFSEDLYLRQELDQT